MQDPDRRVAPGSAGDLDSQPIAGSSSHLQRLRDATGEGRRTMSWIWYGANTNNPDAQGTELYEGIRVEWCKAYARLRRWREQIPLIREEMRRTPISLRRRASEWEARRAADNREGPLGEGARAYAIRQRRLFEDLATHFEAMFAKAPKEAQIGLDYARQLDARLQEGEADEPEEQDDEDSDGSDGED